MCLQHSYVLINKFGSGIVHALCIGTGIQGVGMDASLSSAANVWYNFNHVIYPPGVGPQQRIA